MSYFDAEQFKSRVQNLTDDELIALVTINAKQHVSEAVLIADAEIEKRGLAADVQNVIFDLTLNTSGFAGRLILLDEQIMFLSTGRIAGGGNSGNTSVLVGVLSDATLVTPRVAAENLDFSALDNEGSWIYYLDQIRRCYTKSSFMAGKQLLFEVTEEDGSITEGGVQCGNISNEELEALADKVLDAKAKFESK